MMSLVFAEYNKKLKIKEIKGRDKDKQKLIEQGFCSDTVITLLEENNRNYIVKLNENKYILGFSLANKIIVENI